MSGKSSVRTVSVRRGSPTVGTLLAVLALACTQPQPVLVDTLLLGGRVLDGAGNPWMYRDIGILGDRITFVGVARDADLDATDTLDVSGLLVTPGFWDMHSHAELGEAFGYDAAPFLYQGITTVVLGVDGGGSNQIDSTFQLYRSTGIGVNALRYVGHAAARRTIMGESDRAPTAEEMSALEDYVRTGMEQGALGLSSGLFYIPGTYAETEEVITLNRVAAEYGGIYDTHDRDLGAVYQGVGYEASVREAIEIGERAGTPVIFSHFNLQGAHNYGRASVGIALVEDARARGVDVMAAQHVYTATQSNLRSYALPSWASAGGRDDMLQRFDDPTLTARLDAETMEMLAIRGGAEKIMFVDRRPELNGKTLAQVATGWQLPVPQTVRRILAEDNATVMNLDLYDIENTRLLAQQEWMMTCTDGRTPPPDAGIVHPRPYGAFTRKLRQFVLDEGVVSLPFAVRGMTSLAANFLRIPERGMIAEGFFADIAVLDEDAIRDRATYEDPHQFSEGTVHVIVNGVFAFRDGRPTGELPGRPIRRGGALAIN